MMIFFYFINHLSNVFYIINLIYLYLSILINYVLLQVQKIIKIRNNIMLMLMFASLLIYKYIYLILILDLYSHLIVFYNLL